MILISKLIYKLGNIHSNIYKILIPKLGIILVAPLTLDAITRIVSLIVFFVALVGFLYLAKKQNILKKTLTWWFFGSLILGGVFYYLGTALNSCGMSFVCFSGVEGLFAGILWLAYFPILAFLYLFFKSKSYKNGISLTVFIIIILCIGTIAFQFLWAQIPGRDFSYTIRVVTSTPLSRSEIESILKNTGGTAISSGIPDEKNPDYVAGKVWVIDFLYARNTTDMNKAVQSLVANPQIKDAEIIPLPIGR